MIITLRTHETLDIGDRTTTAGGLKIKRVFSREEAHPYNLVEWKKSHLLRKDYKTGDTLYDRVVEHPVTWADNAVQISSEKYLNGNKVEDPEFEDSLRQPFDRIANTYTVWGWQQGYFADVADAEIFNEEIKALLVRQMWAPNSPVWFNIGHWEQWRWGRPDLRPRLEKRGNKAFYATGDTQENLVAHEGNTGQFPQASACFLISVEDSMEAILRHYQTEGRIFASGSGVGINISTLRSSKETISGKGKSSGAISFDKGFDRSAGAIKSGGKTRRAARMVLMDSDHPDIFEFIKTKNDQEKIAKIILREHNVHVELVRLAKEKQQTGTPAEKIAAALILQLPLTNEEKYDQHMDGLLYGETLACQNANHSVSFRGEFWQAVKNKGEYATRLVTNPKKTHKTFRAEELLDLMAEMCWANGEPGMHNSDFINLWNPAKAHGRINTSNPCSEYLHQNETSCNLSSANVYRFYDAKTGRINVQQIQDWARLAMICADLNIERGGFPIPRIATQTRRYRTTGIGYANVGGLLMATGVPYDSDEGRYIAAQLTNLLTASCWVASAEIAAETCPYPAWTDTENDVRAVIRLHKAASELLAKIPNRSAKELAVEIDAIPPRNLPEAEGLCGLDALKGLLRSFETPGALSRRISIAEDIKDATARLWSEAEVAPSFRNNFVTVFAPTGCLTSGTMVPTSRGLLKLEDLGDTQGAQWQDERFLVDTDEGTQAATRFYVNGRAETRRIRTQHGYQLQGTEKHQVKVLAPDGTFVWRKLGELSANDIVPMRMNNLVGNANKVRLPELPSFHGNATDVAVPKYVNQSLAEYVGYFMGDGSLHEKGIRLCVSQEDTDVVEHLQMLSETLFGTRGATEQSEGYINVHINSVPLRNWFLACGFSKKEPAQDHRGKGKIPHIPTYLLETNDPRIYGSFLRGLFEADGTVTLGLPCLSSAYDTFIQDVMSVMLAIGMPVTLDDRGLSGHSGERQNRIRIRNGDFMPTWNRLAGFIGTRKRNRCQKTFQRTENENIPATVGLIKGMNVDYKDKIPYATLNKGWLTRGSAERLLQADNKSECALELARRLQFTYEKVETNLDGGIQSTFDLSVPKNVTYVANGFISHNTISAPMGIYDEGTTSIEPDYTLVKSKQLSGGGSIRMFNSLALEGLRNLAYPEELVREAALEVAGIDGLFVAVKENIDDYLSAIRNAPKCEHGPVRKALTTFLRQKDARKLDDAGVLSLFVELTKNLNTPGHTESPEAVLVVNGKSHMEAVPWLRAADLAVFDCSSTNNDAVRSIHHTGHLRMLGAVQPFLSGAASKTVNMPYSSTVGMIKDSYILAHRLGVKCIALFRAESKANSVFQTDTPEGKKYLAATVWKDVVTAAQSTADQILAEAHKPRRRKLPGRRHSQTVKFSINGKLKGYITAGVYKDMTCGEVFGRIGLQGSLAAGMLEAYCKMLSSGLQYGMPLESIIEDFKFFSFEPSGFCKVGDDTESGVSESEDLRRCDSIIDLITRILDWMFPVNTAGVRTLRSVGELEKKETTLAKPGEESDEIVIQAIDETPPAPASQRPPCPKCGSHNFVQDGHCKSCRNCGFKDGGCGE